VTQNQNGWDTVVNPDGSTTTGKNPRTYDPVALAAAGKIIIGSDANGPIIVDDPTKANQPKTPEDVYTDIPLYDMGRNLIGWLHNNVPSTGSVKGKRSGGIINEGGPGDDTSGYAGMVLIRPDGSAEPWTGGTAVTGTGQAVNLNKKGEAIGTARSLPESWFTGNVGGGSGHTPTPYGYSAPDPLGAASVLLKQYDNEIAAGRLTVDQAKDAFDRDWNEIVSNSNIESTNVSNQLTADTTNASNALRRGEGITQAQGRLNSEATDRARIMQALMLNSLPAGTTVNVQGAGNVPLHHTNVDQLLNQGLPSLASQFSGLDALFPNTQVTPGQVSPIVAPPRPPMWTPPQQPNLDALIAQGAAGSGPIGWA